MDGKYTEVSKRGKASFQRSEEVGGMPPQWQSSKDSGDSCFTALEAASASPARMLSTFHYHYRMLLLL